MISHGKAISRLLNTVAGKFLIQHLREGFEHQVLVAMCMVVVSFPELTLRPNILVDLA
jgi:hypothetical protein